MWSFCAYTRGCGGELGRDHPERLAPRASRCIPGHKGIPGNKGIPGQAEDVERRQGEMGSKTLCGERRAVRKK